MISKFYKAYAHKSFLLLASIDWGRIGVEAAKTYPHFLLYPLLREAQKKIADLTVQNAKVI
jgi:hypothetical protein